MHPRDGRHLDCAGQLTARRPLRITALEEEIQLGAKESAPVDVVLKGNPVARSSHGWRNVEALGRALRDGGTRPGKGERDRERVEAAH